MENQKKLVKFNSKPYQAIDDKDTVLSKVNQIVSAYEDETFELMNFDATILSNRKQPNFAWAG